MAVESFAALAMDAAFVRAARRGDVGAVRRWLDLGLPADLVPIGLPDTPLSAAVKGGNVATAELLLAHGANPDRALRVAIREKRPEMVRLLLRHGAGREKGLSGSLQSLAREVGTPEIVEILETAQVD